jgi:hypothetical protein
MSAVEFEWAAHSVATCHEDMAGSAEELQRAVGNYAGRLDHVANKIVELQEAIGGLTSLHMLDGMSFSRDRITECADLGVNSALRLQGTKSQHGERLISNAAEAKQIANDTQSQVGASQVTVPASVNGYLELALADLQKAIQKMRDNSESIERRAGNVALSSRMEANAYRGQGEQ